MKPPHTGTRQYAVARSAATLAKRIGGELVIDLELKPQQLAVELSVRDFAGTT